VQNRNSPLPSLKPLFVLLFGFMVAFHLGCALKGRSFIRASHLGTALEYAQGSIDLMHPHLVGFNANGAPTAQELPLWQAVTAVVFKLTRSTWYGWGNLVSLALFASALWPFYRLAREYLGERAAGWATVFFLSEPLIIVYGGEAATDGFCLVLTVWFLYFADLLVRTGAPRWWLPAAMFGALAAVEKLPFFMAAGLCSVCMLLVHRVGDWRRWVMLGAVGMFSAAALFVWGRHADTLAAQAVFPYYELRVSQNPHLQLWYFGDLHSRLSAAAWIKGGWRFLHATLGVLPFAAILAVGFVQAGNRLPKLWLLMTFLTTLVFTPLVLNHWHYYLMCAPPVAMVCGSVLARWEPFLASELPRPWLRTAIVALAFLGSALAGLITMKISLELDTFPQQIAMILREKTKPEDKLVVYGRQLGEAKCSSARVDKVSRCSASTIFRA
jgi:4-amino-4-deoxy-L-arabinose transferase-like glycosyltransferase